ncbi:myosin a [Theileria orientalis strain Shintoku]|uniref:Myosin-A n=1 Tax=Theileria orientalis strain Shintoku TaxID=869250 RepID=J4D5H8_THEOR|nr:myosin a [Theileria orientalis strain Shintoku]BAM38975.1 myosin a [Theileria orientalis strain Shintoku]|eukprot:XP_009689276.1 myosin a [Theileria orientalis strain Shintoku]
MDLSTKEKLQTANALKRASSNLAVFDSNGNVLNGTYVWTDMAPAVKENPDIMFAKCLVHHGSTKDVLVCTQVEPPYDKDKKFEVPASNAWNTNSQIDPMTYGDIGMLPQTSIPCVLDFLKHRFHKNQIYSTADPLVVSINPFKDLGNAGQNVIDKYRGAKNLMDMPPHVYYTSRRALENLHDFKYSQTVIVSGESGTGKTQSANMMMRYFASGGTQSGHIQQVVMAFNPVLESFGNAKTIRNNNSSRFGRFMQLDVAPEGGIRYGSIVTFLLEKSRIVTQDDDERSYHIFYQLLRGASEEMRSKFKLLGVSDYNYLNKKCTEINGVSDAKEFEQIMESFEKMNLSQDQKDTVLSVLSGVLLLGNVVIEGEERDGLVDAAVVTNTNVLRDASDLLFLDYDQLVYNLTTKSTNAGGSVIVSPRRRDDSNVLKMSLSKAVYNKLFLWLVNTVNKTIEPPQPFKRFIGLLDIFGFEVFKNNSLEQLFINITNEMLQTNFINIVFKRESQLYREEGISAPELQYSSNADVIDLLCNKGKSILSVLEDQCLAPGGNDLNVTSTCNSQLGSNPKYLKAKQDGYFMVVHTIGPIQYSASGFVNKNKDLLTGELVTLVNASANPLVKQLFEGEVISTGKLAKGMLIGSQFMSQLESLMALINSTDSHFIRCISPNDRMLPMTWNSVRVLLQLHALSVIEALQLRKLGFSYRRPFKDFVEQYYYISPKIGGDKTMSDLDKALALVKEGGLSEGSYAVGKTRMFLTRKAANELTSVVRERLARWAPLADVLEALMVRWNNQKELKKSVKSVVRLQAHLRRLIVDSGVTPKPNQKELDVAKLVKI